MSIYSYLENSDVVPKAEPTETTIRNDKGELYPIVNYIFEMKDEVEESIFNYLAGN